MSNRLPSSYADYLKSEDWKCRRDRALYLAQHRCQSPICADAWVRSLPSEAIARLRNYRLEVHHLTYERIGRERQDDLIVLCETCHRQQHGLAPPEYPDRPTQPKSIAEALAGAITQIARAFEERDA